MHTALRCRVHAYQSRWERRWSTQMGTSLRLAQTKSQRLEAESMESLLSAASMTLGAHTLGNKMSDFAATRELRTKSSTNCWRHSKNCLRISKRFVSFQMREPNS